jgi:SAM-dependent methyltransferase
MIRSSRSPCGLCGAEQCHPLESTDRDGKPLDVVICGGCGVVRNDPIPDAEELVEFYEGRYRLEYKGTEEPKARHAARYFPRVARHILAFWRHYGPGTAILDVGCGSGEFLFLMQALGKQAAGLEPNRGYAGFCRNKLGLQVTTGGIDTFQTGRRFDHIRLCHVVEHLADPADKIRRASDWLAENGTMYVEVPDFGEYCRRKSPGRIFHYGHLYNFDADSFGQLVARAGMCIRERTGDTSAFLAKDPGSVPREIRSRPPEETLRLYRLHREGSLRSGGGVGRILSKALRLCGEQYRILTHQSHEAIGRRTARALAARLGAPSATTSPNADGVSPRHPGSGGVLG